MTKSPLYYCGEPCSTVTYNGDGYHDVTFTKSRNLIGTLGSGEFGPKYGNVSQRNIMSLW